MNVLENSQYHILEVPVSLLLGKKKKKSVREKTTTFTAKVSATHDSKGTPFHAGTEKRPPLAQTTIRQMK